MLLTMTNICHCFNKITQKEVFEPNSISQQALFLFCDTTLIILSEQRRFDDDVTYLKLIEKHCKKNNLQKKTLTTFHFFQNDIQDHDDWDILPTRVTQNKEITMLLFIRQTICKTVPPTSCKMAIENEVLEMQNR